MFCFSLRKTKFYFYLYQVFQDRFEAAVPAALASLKLAIEIYGPRNVELIPSYLILAEASLGLKQLNQCWEYLSQAQYTVLQQQEQAPPAITSQLARNMAQLSIARKDYDEAARHLANDVCIKIISSFFFNNFFSLDL